MSDIAEKEASEVLQSLLSVERIQDVMKIKNSSQHWHTPEFGQLSIANQDRQNSDNEDEDVCLPYYAYLDNRIYGKELL